jgi:hypothetical protein
MPSLLLERAHTEIARSMFRDVNNENDHFYVFIGRTQPWEDESNPPTVVDNRLTEAITRRDMLFIKRVAPTDIVYLVRNIPWVEGMVVDRYDDSISEDNPAPSGAKTIQTSNFYVLTDDYNVYKCINNNKATPSLVKPTGTSTEIFTTADGYVWKFMYQVPVLDRTKFLSPQWLPVRHYTGGYHFDVNGYLLGVDVLDGGQDYVQNSTHVLIDGDGQGAIASPTVVNGVITQVDVFTDGDAVVHEGSGYSFIFAEAIGVGTGAVLKANLGRVTDMPVNDDVPEAAIPGAIHVIDVLTTGNDYNEATTWVHIDGDGEGAEARAHISNGSLDWIEITNPGVDYNWIEITINSPTGYGATARGIIGPKGGHGFDSVDELYATGFSIMVNMGIEGDTPDIFTGNDYRQLGLIKNPKVYSSNEAFRNVTGSSCFVIEVADPTKYHVDDVITTDDGGEFRVVQIVDYQVWLAPIKAYITAVSTLTNQTTAIGNLHINNGVLIDPEIDVQSGEMLYVNNKLKVARLTEQTETLQIFFSF